MNNELNTGEYFKTNKGNIVWVASSALVLRDSTYLKDIPKIVNPHESKNEYHPKFLAYVNDFSILKKLPDLAFKTYECK